MRKARIAVIIVLTISVLLTGCGGTGFMIFSGGKNTTITANNAETGKTAEVGPISVGKGKTAVVESALDKGALRIDFAEATVFIQSDAPDEVIVGDVIATVTVGVGYSGEFPLDKGEYVLQITAVDTANGKVTIDFN